MQIKKCSCCKEEKPFSEFHKNKSGKFGLANYCIECKKLTRNNPRGYRQPLDTFDKVRGKYVVYEFYNVDDQCIYVGQTLNFIQRVHDHKSNSKFYKEITRIICSVTESLPDMTFLEAQYIIQKKPKYNQRIIGAIASRFKIDCLQIIEYDVEGIELIQRKTN